MCCVDSFTVVAVAAVLVVLLL